MATIKQRINAILDKNKIDDLERFIEKRHCLNTWNSYLVYLFHTIQSAGILTTTIGTGYGRNDLIWIGVGLNVLASLINIYEQTNNSISLKLMKDIIAIRDDKYIDEGIMVEADNSPNQRTSLLPPNQGSYKRDDTLLPYNPTHNDSSIV